MIAAPINMGEWAAQGHSDYCEEPITLVIKTDEESQACWQNLNKTCALPKRQPLALLQKVGSTD